MPKQKAQVITSKDVDTARELEQTAEMIQKSAMFLAGKYKKLTDWVAKTVGEEPEVLREDALFSLGILTGEMDAVINAQKNFLEDYARFREVFMTSTKPKKEELH